MIRQLKAWALKLKLELAALFIAAKDERTPRMAKLLAIGVTAYALSPIDLIPDFIPVLGYLDDLIIVPAGIALIVKLVPTELMADFRRDAQNLVMQKKNWIVAIAIVTLWAMLAATLAQHYT